jgi:hypothetical protein
MAIRINTEDNEIIVSDVATEETLRDLLKAVEVMNGQKSGSKKADPVTKQTQDELKKLAKSNKDLNITMKEWSGNFDDTMEDLDKTIGDRSKAVAGALGKIVKNTSNVIADLVRGPASFDTLGRAVQQGAGAIGDGLGSAVDSIQVLGTKVPGVGAAMQMAGATIGAAAMAAAAYAQNMSDGFVALSQSGANYNGDIVKTASQIQNLGLNMNSFTQIVQSNAQGLAQFGGSVSLGAKRFTELAEVTRNQFGGELYALGIRYEEQAEQLAKFTQTQSRNTAFQNMGYMEQSRLYKEYITDLNVLTGLTGKSRQQLSEEMAANELRADAAVRLKGATLDAQQAISMVFNTTGSDSAISQVLMAGIAGKDLALEMAAGNSTIKSFVAGNAEAAEKIRDLGEAVANGEISQKEFRNGLRDIMPSIAASGEEFEGLYGISDVATTMTQAASDIQKLQVQFDNLGKAVGPSTSATSSGAGGKIMAMEATIQETINSIKSGVNQGISELAAEFGIGKNIGADIQNMINTLNGMQAAFSDFLTSFIIVAKAPWDFLMGGTSTKELKKQLLEKMEAMPEVAANAGITADKVNSADFTGDDATAMLMAFGDNINAKDRVADVFKKINDRNQVAVAESLESMEENVSLKKNKDGGYGTVNLETLNDSELMHQSTKKAERVEKIEEKKKEVEAKIKKEGSNNNYAKQLEIYNNELASAHLNSPSSGEAAGADMTLVQPGTSNDDVEGFGNETKISRLMTQWVNANSGTGTGVAYQSGARDFADDMSNLIDQNDGKWPEGLVSTKETMQELFNSTGIGKAGDMLDPSWDGKKKDLWWIRSTINNELMNNFGDKDLLFRQYGGPVGVDNPYVVGERGPELFKPMTAGTITPNDELATAKDSVSLTSEVMKSNELLKQLIASANSGNEIATNMSNASVSKLDAILGSNRKSNRHIQDLAQQG